MLAHLSRMFLVMRVFFLQRNSFGKSRAVTGCRQREKEERQNSGSVISADESIRNITDDARSKIVHSRLINSS